MNNVHSTFKVASLALVALLAACSNEPENLTAGGPADPDAAEVAAAPKVELPPMLAGSRTYRCKDNSLVHIDFFNNNTALYKTDKDATTGTTLTAAEPGQPYTAEGYSVSGNTDNIELTAPGKGSTTCKA